MIVRNNKNHPPARFLWHSGNQDWGQEARCPILSSEDCACSGLLVLRPCQLCMVCGAPGPWGGQFRGSAQLVDLHRLVASVDFQKAPPLPRALHARTLPPCPLPRPCCLCGPPPAALLWEGAEGLLSGQRHCPLPHTPWGKERKGLGLPSAAVGCSETPWGRLTWFTYRGGLL
jgi:hypothetical protein